MTPEREAYARKRIERPTAEIDKRTGLPKFLIIPQHVRDAVWVKNPPEPMPLMAPPTSIVKEYQPPPEFAVAKKARSIGRLKAWRREGSVRRDAKGVLRNQDGVPVRWDTMRSKFVPEWKFMNVGSAPSPPAARTIIDPAAAAPAAKDSLPNDIKSRYGMNVAKLKKFAVMNGVWDDKYAALPNPGLVRMNVVNRLRAKVRKGHKVEWT